MSSQSKDPFRNFQEIRKLARQLRAVGPGHELLAFSSYMLGEVGRAPEIWSRFQDKYESAGKTQEQKEDAYIFDLKQAIQDALDT